MSPTKNFVFLLSLIGGGIFVTLLLALLYNFCGPYRGICKEAFSFVVYLFSPLPLVFFFSLITYKLPEQVFRAWWSVAVWFVPILIIVTYLLNSSHQQSGFSGVAQGAFYLAIELFFFFVFFVVSLIKIFFAWRRAKTGNV